MNIPKRWGDPDLEGATQLRSSGIGFPYIITADERPLRFSADGTNKTAIEPEDSAGVWRGIAAMRAPLLTSGLLWGPDQEVSSLFQINRAGLDYEIVYTAGFEGLIEPGPMSVNRELQFYVIEPATDEIHRFEIDGTRNASFGGSGSGHGQLSGATDLQAGVEGVYVADTGNNRVQQFDPDGNFIAQWGGGGTGKA